jgi:hypothetical protein
MKFEEVGAMKGDVRFCSGGSMATAPRVGIPAGLKIDGAGMNE